MRYEVTGIRNVADLGYSHVRPPVAANGGTPVTETTDQAADPNLRNDLEDIYGRYEELRSGVDELQRSVATMQVSAESETGEIRATVDADGLLIDLRLNPDACREWSPETLARVIVETVQHASAGKSRQIEQLVTNHRSNEDA
ncbi:YbaB/EbfC family nucleoid-associated protein [Actinoplanes italicus]|uniref:YbaB/EbfC family nucleoid-associated protein n=1 Tax=Actinoplanes italicus TaxID=113567 RepID=UPI001EF30612|nr:YbaB/EbfC family nucleoid-associated protein [Actinoplanes italicus]